MDRPAGIAFSLIFGCLGWAFAPFDTLPFAALCVSIVVSCLGLGGALYFAIYGEIW